MKIKTSILLLATAAALSACQSSPGPRPLPTIASAPTVDGTWSDPNGLISTFSAGKFDTRTTDGSNAVLASGTYITQPNGVVEISLFSNLKKTTSRVNCSLAGTNQLNCTADSGTQFSLARRG